MTSFPVSENVAEMQTSSTLKAGQIAANLREQGFDVIDLTLGEPDFQTPEFIKEFAWEGLQKGLTKYTPTTGLKTFQESVAAFYAEEFNTSFAPNEVIATDGGKQALFNAACTILNPSDEVLIPKPYWVTFPEIVNFCRAKNVFYRNRKHRFWLDGGTSQRSNHGKN